MCENREDWQGPVLQGMSCRRRVCSREGVPIQSLKRLLEWTAPDNRVESFALRRKRNSKVVNLGDVKLVRFALMLDLHFVGGRRRSKRV